MFDNISKKRLKWLLLFKYFFQFFVAPLIIALLCNILFFIVWGFLHGFTDAIQTFFIQKQELSSTIHMHAWVLVIIIVYIFNFVNILSVLPFIKLIIDCFSKKDEESKEIKLTNFLPFYELQCIRQSKRFMCDTFSRRENDELFLYDEDKNKYRLFWNDKYGDKEKFNEVLHASRIRVSYFKHSKIIFRIEVAE